jgi:hypothetical protein
MAATVRALKSHEYFLTAPVTSHLEKRPSFNFFHLIGKMPFILSPQHQKLSMHMPNGSAKGARKRRISLADIGAVGIHVFQPERRAMLGFVRHRRKNGGF